MTGPTGPIVALLGPCGAGKSSVGRHLARRLGWEQRSLDATCWNHYLELPEVAAAERTLVARHGEAARNDRDRRRYLQRLAVIVGADWLVLAERMRLHAAVRALTDAGPAVVDFGGGHARLVDPDRRAALDAALGVCRLAVWLQPWSSVAETLIVLAGRLRAVGRQFDETTLRSTCDPAARPRAASPLFTGDRSPDMIAAELLARLQSP